MKKTIKILRNRYIITVLIFVVSIIFFHPIDFLSQWNNSIKLKELKREKTRLEQEVGNTKEKLEELTTNIYSKEVFGREQYRMKKNDEVIFLITSKEEAK